jgi:hypothetical protein
MNQVVFKHADLAGSIKFTLAAKQEGDLLKIGGTLCGEGESFCKKLGRTVSQSRLETAKNKNWTIPMTGKDSASYALNEYSKTLFGHTRKELKELFKTRKHVKE